MKHQNYDLKIEFGSGQDIENWMKLVRTVSPAFPGLETEATLEEHRNTVLDFMERQEAVCAKLDGKIAGVLLFSRK